LCVILKTNNLSPLAGESKREGCGETIKNSTLTLPSPVKGEGKYFLDNNKIEITHFFIHYRSIAWLELGQYIEYNLNVNGKKM